MGSGCLNDGYHRRKSESLSRLTEEIEEAINVGEKCKLDKDSFQHQLVVGCFLAVIEISDSIRILLEQHKTHDSRILLRSVLEVLVRLYAFSDFEDCVNRERLEFSIGTLKTLKHAKNGNPYFSQIAQMENIEDAISEQEAQIQRYRNDCIGKQLTLADLSEKTGFSEEYNAIYRQLSALPHGTYAGIIRRSLVVDWEKDSFHVASFQKPAIEDLELIANQAADWVIRARAVLTVFLDASHIRHS